MRFKLFATGLLFGAASMMLTWHRSIIADRGRSTEQDGGSKEQDPPYESADQHGRNAQLSCHIDGKLMALRGLPEASGVAASRANPGMLWSHNDSGPPVIFAVAPDGVIKGRVSVSGARVEDWEDIAVGPCAQGSCVYIADIGDNGGSRRQVTVYRVAEPKIGDSVSQPAEAFRATYPDGPHDAEAIIVTSATDIFVVTKTSPSSVYRFPSPLRSDSIVQLQRVATLDSLLPKERITGASASPDGRWVVLRTHRSLLFYRAATFLTGDTRRSFQFDISPLREPQGEGVALASDGTVYLTGEVGRELGGTLARLTCALE